MLPMVTAGHGSTVAVLPHQTDGNGLCGWLPFAAKIVKDPSVAIIAFDLCGYGDASCLDGSDSADVAALAVDMARRDLHAHRVVVVGASMGGSIALITAAGHVQVEAAADLSGPVRWPGMASVRGGHALHVPVLVAMADTESRADIIGAQDIVANAPKGSTFLEPSAGHGYDLLLDPSGQPGPLAAPLLAWIKG